LGRSVFWWQRVLLQNEYFIQKRISSLFGVSLKNFKILDWLWLIIKYFYQSRKKCFDFAYDFLTTLYRTHFNSRTHNFILKRFSLIFLFLRVESTNRLFVLCQGATLIINAFFFFIFCWLWAVKTGRRAIFTLYSFAFSWLHRPQSLNVLYYWFTESGRSLVHISKGNLLGSSWKFTCRVNSKQWNCCVVKKKKKLYEFYSLSLL